MPPITPARVLAWILQVMRQAGLPALALFLLHVFISLRFDAYVHLPGLDVPMHVLGGIFIASFFHCASRTASAHGLLGPFHALTHAILVFALTCAATVVWEFGEFLSDRWIGTQAQLGLADTLGDMLCGILGGLGFLILASIRSRRLHA